MIDVIDILKDCKSRYFSRYAGKETLWLLCVIAYHHELIIELSPEAWRQAVQTEITKEKSGNARLFCNATGIYSEVYASIY